MAEGVRYFLVQVRNVLSVDRTRERIAFTLEMAITEISFFLLNLIMTTTQIKTEIQKVLDNVPETALQDVLDFLKELQSSSLEQIKLTNHLRHILAEERAFRKTCSMIEIKRVENIHKIPSLAFSSDRPLCY